MRDAVLEEDLEILCESCRELFMDLEKCTVLVTGATGLIGSQIVKALLRFNDRYTKKIHLVGVSRGKERAIDVFRELLNRDDFEMIYGDISEGIGYAAEVDYMIHGANTTSSLEYVKQPVETIRSIVGGTDQALTFAKDKKVKGFVYLSSMEMYGKPLPDMGEIKEEMYGIIDPLKVRSSYSEGKRMAECLCVSYAEENDVPIKIARLAQVFGADVSGKDNRVFVQMAKSVLNHTDIVLHTEGHSTGNYCYTRDAVAAILLILLRGEIGAAYNVVNEETNRTIREMAYLVANKIANQEIQVKYEIPESDKAYGYAPDVKLKLSSYKLRELGWESQVGLEEMYLRMIESFRERDIR